MNLLEINNLETYYGPVMAIRGVSLNVPRGAFVTLLGGNGAGKTTVLKTISGAIDPQKGTIAFSGESILGKDPDVIALTGIAHVPEGREVFPFLTVDENLKMGAFTRKDNDIKADIDAVYDYFPALKSLAKAQAVNLSGGQQQRVAVARAISGSRSLILADEPTGNLDVKSAQEIIHLFQDLCREDGISILMVTHDPLLASMADRMLLLKDGLTAASDIRSAWGIEEVN